MKILHVVGARPNFMKISPITKEMAKYPECFHQILVHTGQHYDTEMSQVFFNDLGIPHPDIYLGVGSGSHAEQTAKVMLAFEPVLLEQKPDLVLVVGDVNSTLACALVCAKLQVPVAHVEAGLRSFDRTMPEEINRILTDQISDLLFTTERAANDNLLKEGIAKDKIYFVGNVMIDTLLEHCKRAINLKILEKLNLKPKNYALLTLHRPSNVDQRNTLMRILDAIAQIQTLLPIVFPAHPRTIKRIQELGFQEQLMKMPNVRVLLPMGYLEFLNLMSNARLVLTDSGGIQEETTILGIPCLTLRENTERPVTISEGTNILVGNDPERIITETIKILEGKGKIGKSPELWDGHAAERIVAILRRLVK